MANAIIGTVSFAARFCRRTGSDSRKTVLIVANDPMGDTLIRIPFYFTLRKELPRERYRIVAILTPPMAPALKELACFDEIIEEPHLHTTHAFFWIFRRHQFLCSSLRWASKNKVHAFVACLRLRSLGCDYLVSLSQPDRAVAYTSDMNAGLFPASARYQKRVCDRKYTALLPSSSKNHQLDDLKKMTTCLLGRDVPLVRISQSELMPMLDFAHARKQLPTEYTVLVPGAGKANRCWPADRFIDLAKRIGGRFAVVGSREEFPLGEKIACAIGPSVVNLCGKTSVSGLGGVLANARVVIANETGTATYATILRVPTVCILGGGDYGAFFPNPYYENAASVTCKPECFCKEWHCDKPQIANESAAPCITAIGVDAVYEATAALMTRMKKGS